MNIKISIEHDTSQVPVIGKVVRHLCVNSDTDPHPSVNKIELAAVELLNNIIHYSESAAADATIHVHCRFEGEDFNVTVTSSGAELSEELAREYSNDDVRMPDSITDIEDLPESGWGIQLIKSACDEVSYRRVNEKNEYRLAFDLSEADE